MGLPINARLLSDSKLTTKEPTLVLKIDGIDTAFGSGQLQEAILIGAPGLVIGSSWVIGGYTVSSTQDTLITLDGTTTSIQQQLEPDKGRGSSVQSMAIELVDIGGAATELITPGVLVDDVLGRKAKVYLALSRTASFPEDYVLLFRGIIDDITAGPASITINISHPDNLKKQLIYQKVEHKLSGAITDSQTTITLDSVSNLLLPVTGPSGAVDTTFSAHIRIDNEIIKYTGISGLDLTGCVRGAFATIPVAHADEADIVSFYRLEGTAMEVAQKMMISTSGYWSEIELDSFNVIPFVGSVANTIYFDGINISDEEGLTVGDFITTTLATNAANNVTLKEVIAITQVDGGSYIEVDGVAFIDEPTTAGKIKFRSKYDSWPEGLGMGGDQVDVAQHEYLERTFLSSFEYDFYLKDTIENAKEWLETEVYLPASCYSVPRKTKSSAQLHIGPLPSADTKTLSKTNIINPSKLKVRRSTSKNFFNTIVYRFEDDALEDKFLKGRISQDAGSLARIPVGSRALVVNSKGMRTLLNAPNLADIAATRKLNRYKYGAESLEGVQVTFGDGFVIEVGDVIILDPTDLNVVNTVDGDRQKPAAFFEVINKTLNYKTGEVSLNLTDTNFATNARYGLIGISSNISAGISQTQFVISQIYPSVFGVSEYQKWDRYPNCAVKVKSPDGVTRFAQTIITSSTSNTITVRDALGFTPQPGDIMELADYDFVDTTHQIKLIYSFLSDTIFADGKPQYQML